MTPIPNYSNYLIDTNGRVYSTIRNKYLKPHIMTIGYPAYTLLHDTRGRICVPVHRLLANTFLPNPENKREINHIDGDKTNNQLSNLEWVHGYENIRHAFTTGLTKTPTTMDYTQIDNIVQKLLTDPSSNWLTVSSEYGYSDSSGLRKLIKRDYLRRNKLNEFNVLCSELQRRAKKLHAVNMQGRVAHNRKSVKVLNVGIFESLASACKTLDLSTSKACVAIQQKKPIKGYYLDYA